MTRAGRWLRRCAAPGYPLALAVVVVAPLAAPGYLLLRDAVSTPRSYLSDAALGLGGSAPRALPQDFAIAVASHLLDGGVVVKMLLVAGLWLAGFGAARLVAAVLPDSGLPGQLVAATVAIWNPYVGERLLQGHWSLLVGYGCLPWVATAMLALRGDDRTGPAGLAGLAGPAFWIALAGLTPTGLLLAATVALSAVAAPGSGRPRTVCAAVATGAATVSALPWLIAAALGAPLAPPGGPEPGVAAFAARAEPGLGTLGSLAGLGGIWNAEAVPTSRTTLFAVLATLVLLGVVGAGVPALRRRPAAVPLLVLAVVAVLGAAAAATGAGRAALVAVIEIAPGLGLLRDAQKWVALAMPGYALAAAGAVGVLRRWISPAAAALTCCLALVLALPDLAWGLWGKVEPVRYPPGWTAVAAVINDDPAPVAVLPAGAMRGFDWAGPAPVLDPLPRWVRADVWSTGDLYLSGTTVAGEGARARAVQTLLFGGADPADLSAAGVGWVVVESGTAGEMGSAPTTLRSLPVAYRDADLALYRVGGHGAGASPVRRSVSVAAHLGWLMLLFSAGAITAVSAWRRRGAATPPR